MQHQGAPARGLRIADILTVRDETDTTGRLLLEDSAPKKARKTVERGGVAMKSVRCPYHDTPSRIGGLINISAYEALRHDTGPLLDGFAWLARCYHARQPANRSTVQGLLDVSNLGLSLPLVLLRRADDPVPPHGAMPTFVASLFKASRGVFSAAVDMLNQQGNVPTTAAEVVQFADEHHHLKRQATGRACAAPTRLIERTLAVVLTGEGADAQRSQLKDLVAFEHLWRFYTLNETFNAAVNKYRWFLEQIAKEAGTVDPEVLFATQLQEGGRRFTFGEFTTGFLDHLNSVQADLNRVLGRSDDVAPLTYDDALRLL